MPKTTKHFIKDLWLLTKPYWFSEERWVARGLLAAIVSLNLGLVYVNVLINKWNNDFYNTLQNMDKDGFFHQILKFGLLALVFILFAVYQLYLKQMLQIKWRRWLTANYINDWASHRTYYYLQLTGNDTDNPDQRIADDLNRFCENTVRLSLGLLSSVVTLITFITILWGLSGSIDIPFNDSKLTIPGYMVWVALIYAVGGTYLSHIIGRALINLNFNQQKFEANFRFSLIRFRENAESIALYHGEKDEKISLEHSFTFIRDNWWALMRRTKALTWFQAGYGQIANIFPYVVAAPRYFAGSIKLGGLMQIGSAFGQVQDASSWFVSAYGDLAEWRATVERLTTFRLAMDGAQTKMKHANQLKITPWPSAHYALNKVSLSLPNGKQLVNQIDLEFKEAEHVLITGASGCGKSTLFRTLSGIWPFASGTIMRPEQSSELFLPQKPYLTIGTLREQLSYPTPASKFTDQQMVVTLLACGLDKFTDRLHEKEHWSHVLSGGEQQRIAICRALLQKPDWLFLDESTSAVDEATEEKLYQTLQQQLPNTTIISIGHRTSLEKLHHKTFNLSALA
jgi:putative ATP-binding cassette transporter